MLSWGRFGYASMPWTLGIALALGSSACAVTSGFGTKIPNVWSSDYKSEKLPPGSKLPTVERSADEIRKMKQDSEIRWCDTTATPPIHQDEKLAKMKAALSFWESAPRHDPNHDWLQKKVSDMVAQNLNKILGFKQIEKFGLVCTDATVAVNINGTWLGPFDIALVHEGLVSTYYNVALWSVSRRHFLHLHVPGKSDDPATVVYADMSSYVPKQDYAFHGQFVALGTLFEAVLLDKKERQGWYIKSPYGGGPFYGEPVATLSKLEVTP